ncbi:MAG: outer membrane lipoprotein-sorting protein, partial [Ignavibacteriae bacterium]|nr:outer membrane lipoprotein-sorting protein [Ignavibacteriota bacterium]
IMTLISCFAYSQTVDEIVNKMDKSRGGSEAYSKIQNWKMTGTTSMMGQSIAFIQYFKKPNLFRSEQDMMGQHIVQTFDGKQGWMINPMTGSSEPQPMDSMTIEQMKKMNDIFEGPVTNYKEKGLKIDLLGKEDIKGTSCFKMKIVNKQSESTLWVNSETYLPVQMKSTVNQMGHNMEVETGFLDYKDFQNVKMPTKVIMMAMGMEIAMLFEKIEINIVLDDAIFKKP